MQPDDAARLHRAQHVIAAMQAERGRLQHELRQAQTQVTRLRRTIGLLLQRERAREKEVADASA